MTETWCISADSRCQSFPGWSHGCEMYAALRARLAPRSALQDLVQLTGTLASLGSLALHCGGISGKQVDCSSAQRHAKPEMQASSGDTWASRGISWGHLAIMRCLLGTTSHKQDSALLQNLRGTDELCPYCHPAPFRKKVLFVIERFCYALKHISSSLNSVYMDNGRLAFIKFLFCFVFPE